MTQSASPLRFWFRLIAPFALCLAIAAPAILAQLGFWHPQPIPGAIVSGVAIVAAAFMLGWVGEAAELDLAGGLAVGLLAIVTILPEYVVSIYFAFAAGHDPSLTEYASANVTGANRLLLGFGWPVVAIIGYFALRSAHRKKAKGGGSNLGLTKPSFGISLDDEARTDLGFLLIASLVAIIIPFTGSLHIVVGILLVMIFVAYLWRQSHAERDEPELAGTAAIVGALPKLGRRSFIALVFLLSAAIILACAEPFAHDLIAAGQALGVNQYLLVQWLAPLASEAPEFSLALLFAAKRKPAMGMAILISSKVNQWTALAGSLPIAYVVGGGSPAIPMDGRQSEEFLLTTAQTLMGIALIIGLRLGLRGSAALLGLFLVSFVIPDEGVRLWMAVAYFIIAFIVLVRQRALLKDTFTAPFKLPKRLV
jgi:cation:H+ antiporter